MAVLPAFEHADNSELTALVSGDPEKRDELSNRYDVARAVDYDGYDELLESGDVDAVYVALPNHLHREYTVRAAGHGVHVLCEKPMAVTEFPKRDQFAPELIHFSSCVLEGIDPERDGNEGLADVKVVNAIHESARSGRAVSIDPVVPQERPGPDQVRRRPGIEKPEEVGASSPHEGE